jgi:hypothetical protein
VFHCVCLCVALLLLNLVTNVYSNFRYKALAPVRIGATILLTPLVFRTLTGRDLEEEDEAARKKKD